MGCLSLKFSNMYIRCLLNIYLEKESFAYHIYGQRFSFHNLLKCNFFEVVPHKKLFYSPNS